MTPKQLYQILYKTYGPQHWWPGETPFEVMVGAVLTQNTAWVNVERAIANLREHQALSAEVIVRTHQRRLAMWLKPSGYFNVKASRLKNFCRWLLAEGGEATLDKLSTADLRVALLSVNGIGPETADDMLLYAFARPVFVIDAYTRRILSRLGLISGKEDYETLRAYMEARLQRSDNRLSLFNEYHALLVHHGKQVCRRQPACETCCLRRRCPYGSAAEFGAE